MKHFLRIFALVTGSYLGFGPSQQALGGPNKVTPRPSFDMATLREALLDEEPRPPISPVGFAPGVGVWIVGGVPLRPAPTRPVAVQASERPDRDYYRPEYDLDNSGEGLESRRGGGSSRFDQLIGYSPAVNKSGN